MTKNRATMIPWPRMRLLQRSKYEDKIYITHYLLTLNLLSSYRHINKKESCSFYPGSGDAEKVPETRQRTAAHKVTHLCLVKLPTFVRSYSEKPLLSSPLPSSSYFGIQSTGAHFLNVSGIQLERNKCPENLFQRLISFNKNNLLQRGG